MFIKQHFSPLQILRNSQYLNLGGTNNFFLELLAQAMHKQQRHNFTSRFRDFGPPCVSDTGRRGSLANFHNFQLVISRWLRLYCLHLITAANSQLCSDTQRELTRA